MAVNILSKRSSEMADIAIKNADGSPMLDEANKPVTATCFGPGSKVWQVADAARRRKQVRRTREANGKFEAAFDNEVEDTIEFLCAVTKRFNNLEYPEVTGDADTVRAVYSDPLLGYIRDQQDANLKSWENFMQASATPAVSTSASLPG